MNKKDGIPKEVIEDLKLKLEKENPIEVNVIVEQHQAKIPIPPSIRKELNLTKGTKCKCKITYNEKTKEMICKF